jgi:Flp pilus assembly protein protease CpaA
MGWQPFPIVTLLQLLALTALCALLVAAAITDLRARRIPNRLVGAGAASAVLQQWLLPTGLHPAVGPSFGTPGLSAGLAAGLLMLIAAVVLWRVGLWGAGDAKWLTVLAAHAGPGLVLPHLLCTLMAGGVLALAWKWAGRPNPMPYALAIAGGEVALVAALTVAPPVGGAPPTG